MQIIGYFAQGLICLVYMPLCFQIARFIDEAAARVYDDLAKDIDAGLVPEIASAKVPAVARLFYILPVRPSFQLHSKPYRALACTDDMYTSSRQNSWFCTSAFT